MLFNSAWPLIVATTPTVEQVEAYERLTRLMGPTAAMLLVFLTVVAFILYRVVTRYIDHLQAQLAEEKANGGEWKSLYVGMLQGAGRAVTVADKLLDATGPTS